MKAETPLVSIALPVYNGAKTLATAIRSILMQSMQDWELIIIDDASRDDSLKVAMSFDDPRIRIVKHETNRNLPASLNEAVGMARGKYFARMDQDDVSFPQRIEKQAAYLDKNQEVNIVGAGILLFRGDGVTLGCLPILEKHTDICRQPWKGFYLPHPTWFGRTEWFRKNPYNVTAAKAEDQDLLFRTCQLGVFDCLPEVLLAYREENKCFSKMLNARLAFLSASTHALRHRKYILAFMTLTWQILKIGADFAYFFFRIQIFSRKLLPVPAQLVEEWQKIWPRVSVDRENN